MNSYKLKNYYSDLEKIDISFSVDFKKLERDENFYLNLSIEEKESIMCILYFLEQAKIITGTNI